MELDREVRASLVFLVARSRPHAEIIGMIRDGFGVEVTSAQISRHNPTTVVGRDLEPEFRKLFRKERERFYADVRQWAPISQKAVRIGAYQEMYDNAGRNIHARETALKGAYREMEGDRLTVQGTGKNGAILTENRPMLGTSQAAAVLSAILEQAQIEGPSAGGDIIDADMVDTGDLDGVLQVAEPS